MQDPTSDMAFRPPPSERRRREDDAWEAVVREELVKLRRRSPGAPRVIPARRPQPVDEPDAPPPAA